MDKSFKAFFYGSETPLVIFRGEEMVYELFNEKYQAIYPNRELSGKSIFDAIPELQHSKFPHILQTVYRTGISYVAHEALSRIYNVSTGQIEERYFDTTFSRIEYSDDEEYRILATPREVTDRVLARRKIEEQLRELQIERELRERFVAALSHDLRTPLAIARMATLFLKEQHMDPNEVEEMANRVTSSIDRADRMIRDLLDANRLKAGQGVLLTLNECHIEHILHNVTVELGELFGPRFKLKKDLVEMKASVDKMAVQRMIENLAINAHKYGDSESDIILDATADDKTITITVHNKGNPIAKDSQAHIFDQYVRLKTTSCGNHQGWGIGLSLVKAISDAHGGSVSLESDEENGTTFIVKLPVECKKVVL